MKFLRVIEEGNQVAVDYSNEMTNSGNFMGIPATGKRIFATGQFIREIKNGKVVAEWQTTNMYGMMVQLGVIPPPLNKDEVTKLEAAHCGNDTVKRAFLFSCYTGIRFCDIKVLKWENITSDNRVKIIQVKTKEPLDNLLIQKALDLLGDRGNDTQLVFPLPTGNGTNKNLKLWAEKAGLGKKITYHCSRHSFATNVFDSTRDILTTSKALGHKSIKENQRYIRVPQTTGD